MEPLDAGTAIWESGAMLATSLTTSLATSDSAPHLLVPREGPRRPQRQQAGCTRTRSACVPDGVSQH